MSSHQSITVLGATGMIGAQVVDLLTAAGHRVTAASRSSGVDVSTGAGLADAMAGADAVIDVLNSPTLEDDPALEFFTTSATNVLSAAREAGVAHYVLLSIVGVDGLTGNGYLRGKTVQEDVAASSTVPYSIVRATQFHEFTAGIAESLVGDGEVRAPDALIQPIASADVAGVLARVATGPARNGVHDLGGPEKMTFAEMARTVLSHQGRELPVVVDPAATYFGTPVQRTSLVTGDDAELAPTRLASWLARQ